MERPEPKPEDERRRRRAIKHKELLLIRPRLTLAPPPIVRAPVTEVNLPALAVDLKIRLRSADMAPAMQERAFRCTRALLDANPDEKKHNASRLAMSLKKEFDGIYGPAWHCIVGKSFGSFVTHSSGGFVYFSVEKLSFLLFKTQVRPVKCLQLR
ncbi:hypothetical protein UlMin_026487 [Ulmus minor]